MTLNECRDIPGAVWISTMQIFISLHLEAILGLVLGLCATNALILLRTMILKA